MASRPDPFASALQTLRSANAERRERRLTPVAPAPPRDSDPCAGDPEPTHGGPGGLDADGHPGLAPDVSTWAWAGDAGDSDDGTRSR